MLALVHLLDIKKDPDDCHKLIVDPVAAPVVQQIFQWAYEKVGLNRIVLMLNEGGYPAPSNYKYSTGEITHENLIGEGFWQTRTVMKILKEEKIYRRYGSGPYKNCCT